MTVEIALTLGLVLAATALFWWERFPAEVVALGLLLSLALTGLLPAETAFEGFGSDTVVMITGLLVMTGALRRTGVVDLAGSFVLRRVGDDPDRLLLTIMVTASVLGAFMSNTASTAFFLPIVFGVAQRANLSPSRFLMPLAFATILSSSVTLISTSTNLVISGMMTRYEMEPLSMFELAPVGVPIMVAGLLYMFFVGRRLIPEREPSGAMTTEFGVGPYLSEVVIQPGSALVGKTLAESRLGQIMGLNVLRIARGAHLHLEPRPSTALAAGDVLLVEASQEDIVKVKDTAGVEIKADARLSDPDLEDEDMALAEAIVLPGSPLIGRSLKGHGFRERYGLQVLGLNRRGVNMLHKLSLVPIALGDVLLLQGHRERIARLATDPALRLLGRSEPMEERRPRRRQAAVAIGLFAGVIALASLEVLSLPVAMMAGALLTVLFGCLTPQEAYAAVDWKVVVLIGCMLGVGAAMEGSGTAAWLAEIIASTAGAAHPLWLLAGFFVLTVLLTQPMSNQAAAIVVLPIALQTAARLALSPRTFAIMIAVAASCSYLTPLEPACLMVHGPGRYRFTDFIKVGSLLTLLIFVLALLIVPRIWPLE